MFLLSDDMGEEDKNVIITYESLFDLLRREKDKLDLQPLDKTFYEDVVSYIGEKQKLLQKEQQELFSEEEKQKTEKQLINIKKILRELYERREKKIVNMAIDKSRTKSELIDNSAFLDAEKGLFGSLVDSLDKYREEILVKLINGRPIQPENKHEIKQKPTKMIIFKHAVPKFVGLEGEEFGPFEEQDMASLPAKIADVLVNKGRAEEIKED